MGKAHVKGVSEQGKEFNPGNIHVLSSRSNRYNQKERVDKLKSAC